MYLLKIVILAVVQGFAELLPVSSSAHVVVAEKLMGLDPSSPEMTLVLVMVHTGTMAAVIVYFWKQWRDAFFGSTEKLKRAATALVVASFATAAIGEALIKGIEKTYLRDQPAAEVEQLFSHLELIAPALALVGILILVAGILRGRTQQRTEPAVAQAEPGLAQSGIIGAVQGLSLPFRGFSRSGSTISAGMLAGVPRAVAEEFSFALAVILTPAAIAREFLRAVKAEHITHGAALGSLMAPSLVGAVCAFVAGLLALKWLSGWLNGGRWHWFGIYCLIAAAGVTGLFLAGY